MFSHIYHNALVPIDCSEPCRRAAARMAEFFIPHQNCMVTLQATISPSTSPEARQAKVRHAEAALRVQAETFHHYGVYARRRVVEATDGDPVLAVAQTLAGGMNDEPFDLILMGTYQTAVEFDEQPCTGSFVDRVIREAARTGTEVMILPTG